MGITPQDGHAEELVWAFVIKALRVIRNSQSAQLQLLLFLMMMGRRCASVAYIDHSSYVCTQSWNLEKRNFFGRSLINQPTMCNWIDIPGRKAKGMLNCGSGFRLWVLGEGCAAIHPAVKSLYRLVLLPLRQRWPNSIPPNTASIN